MPKKKVNLPTKPRHDQNNSTTHIWVATRQLRNAGVEPSTRQIFSPDGCFLSPLPDSVFEDEGVETQPSPAARPVEAGEGEELEGQQGQGEDARKLQYNKERKYDWKYMIKTKDLHMRPKNTPPPLSICGVSFLSSPLDLNLPSPWQATKRTWPPSRRRCRSPESGRRGSR